jgi:mitochondrial ATPase complex subunit ATP10
MRHQKGKIFLANNKMFKAEASLYFPNLQGITLEGNEIKDTTQVREGIVSIVTVFSSIWGENQIKTFMGAEHNPEVQELLTQSNGLAQRVDINIEENAVKYGLVKLFKADIRRKMPPPQYGKYFVVRKGVSDEIRERIGLLNSKVGYVFLLDKDCKIRWAACGEAQTLEKDCLVRNLRKLIADAGSKPLPKEAVASAVQETADKVAARAA